MTGSHATAFSEHEAGDLDAGRADVRMVLRRVGTAGLLGPAGEDPAADLGDSVRLIRDLATMSLAAAFSVWSQRMVLEYLGWYPPSEPVPGLVPDLRSGAVTGSTALAPAISDLAGRAELPLVAEPHDDGWRLSGRIGWASNLFDDALVVAPARAPEEGRLVVVFRRTSPGVTPGPLHDLHGLNGTGTGSLVLDGLLVRPGQVLTEDLADFMAVCRPAMLLMQSALAVGLADAALAATGTHLTGAPGVLRPEHEELSDRRDDVARRMGDRADSRVGITPRDLARLRLDAMDVAARAVRLESAVRGAAGYLAGSSTARRVREAAFLPVQAPTEAQLRLEAAQ